MNEADTTRGLARLNLNLLPALEALLRERNVTAAARRLGMSQSAMSHALARLRDLLGDPLLVVSGRKMAITPRGEQIAAALPDALAVLERALVAPAAFAPATATQRFRVATFDYFELTTLPEVLAYLRRHAPGVDLDVERVDAAAIARLVDGEIDLVLGAESMTMPAGLRRRTLYRDPFAVIARPGHPRVGAGRLTLARYVELDHILIAVEGRGAGVVDRALARQGLARRVALRLPHFGSAGLAVLHSDLVCTVASTVAHRARQLHGVRVLEPPLELPSPALVAWWPRQHDDEPARRWFRDILLSGRALSPQLRKLMDAT
jgi:DNA-binding transcriptional LysR family regulator